MEVYLIYTTWPTTESAKAAAHALLDEHLVACANILPAATSIFRWEGKVEEAKEVVMLLKLSRATLQKVVDKLSASHPYTAPCVLVLPVEGSNSAFLQWIAQSSTGL